VAAGRRTGWRGVRGKGQRGRKAGPGKGESDAWGLPEQEVAPGGTRAAVSSADGRWQRGRGRAGEQSRRQRKKERERGPRDLLGICKNLRDLTVN
jgi:hypothetical protein